MQVSQSVSQSPMLMLSDSDLTVYSCVSPPYAATIVASRPFDSYTRSYTHAKRCVCYVRVLLAPTGSVAGPQAGRGWQGGGGELSPPPCAELARRAAQRRARGGIGKGGTSVGPRDSASFPAGQLCGCAVIHGDTYLPQAG